MALQKNKVNVMDGFLSKPENKSGRRKLEIVELPIESLRELFSFEHPFAKSIDIGIEELAESIALHGILQPAIVRRVKDDISAYEILAGHRRRQGAILAGEQTISAIIKDCNDDVAKLIVTETNTETREKMYPSEKAKAYKLQLEALKNQGLRKDLLEQLGEENEKAFARDIVAEMNNTKARQVSRYIRLLELIPSLLDFVDDDEIPINAGYELSFLKKNEQESVYAFLCDNKKFKISIPDCKKIRQASKEYKITSEYIEKLLFGEKKVKNIPVYKTALKGIEKSIKTFIKKQSEQAKRIDEEELKKVLTDALNGYLGKLQN